VKNMLAVVLLFGSFALIGSAQSIKGCRLSVTSTTRTPPRMSTDGVVVPISPDSINNPYGKYGSSYGPYSVTNPYATDAPQITADDGTYLGRYSANQFATDSTSNRFGQHGSPFVPNSVNNDFGLYGSPYSLQSPTNPYTASAPLFSEDE
jgi:hypothetical protein